MKKILTLLLVLVASPVIAGVTLFPNGVSNTDRTSSLATMGQLDPTQYHTYFEDFDYYDSSEWTVTTTETGAGTASEAIQDADGGIFKITTDNATNDTDYLQFGSETFQIESGKKAWFSASFSASNADNASIVMGMQITDTSPLDVSEGIFFMIDGDSALDFYVEDENSATSTTGITTVSNDTYIEVSWYYNGVDEVSYFVDGQQMGHLATTNLPTDSDDDMTVSFGLKNNSASDSTPSLSIDYILMSKER